VLTDKQRHPGTIDRFLSEHFRCRLQQPHTDFFAIFTIGRRILPDFFAKMPPLKKDLPIGTGNVIN
jgi:hypothetical protein